MKLHPSQFVVNEAWILFPLLDRPILTERDGPAICFGLMDAASCFILSARIFPGSDMAFLSKKDFHALLEEGHSHKDAYPKRLLVVQGLPSGNVQAEAVDRGITVEEVPESKLRVFVAEAQEGFRSQFS